MIILTSYRMLNHVHHVSNIKRPYEHTLDGMFEHIPTRLLSRSVTETMSAKIWRWTEQCPTFSSAEESYRGWNSESRNSHAQLLWNHWCDCEQLILHGYRLLWYQAVRVEESTWVNHKTAQNSFKTIEFSSARQAWKCNNSYHGPWVPNTTAPESQTISKCAAASAPDVCARLVGEQRPHPGRWVHVLGSAFGDTTQGKWLSGGYKSYMIYGAFRVTMFFLQVD